MNELNYIQELKDRRNKSHDMFIAAIWIGYPLWFFTFFNAIVFLVVYSVYALILFILSFNLVKIEFEYIDIMDKINSGNGG